MGRIGSGAYEELQNSFMQNEILSIEHDEKKVLSIKAIIKMWCWLMLMILISGIILTKKPGGYYLGYAKTSQ